MNRGHADFDGLQRALDDLRFLEDEKVTLEHNIREISSMNTSLLKENQELRGRLDRMTLDRDKLQAYAVNITTRLMVVGENVQNIIRESGRAAITAANHQQQIRHEAERTEQPDPPQAPQMRIKSPHSVPPREYAQEREHPHTAPPPRQERPIERNPLPADRELEDLVGRIARTAPPMNGFP